MSLARTASSSPAPSRPTARVWLTVLTALAGCVGIMALASRLATGRVPKADLEDVDFPGIPAY